MRMYYLSKRDSREIIEILRNRYRLREDIEKILFVDASSALRNKIVHIYIGFFREEKIPVAMKLEQGYIPAIHALNKGILEIPYAKIDKGAVAKILNGADVMAPGIVETSEFSRGDIVGVKEPDKSLYIAIGRALMSSQEITSVRRGKAIENLHYAGDDIWRVLLELYKKI